MNHEEERTEMKSNFKDVQSFHDKFGLDRHRPSTPSHLTVELARFRLAFLIEELAEFAKATGMTDVMLKLTVIGHDILAGRVAHYETHLDLVDAFDALIDLSVVTHGTADYMGLPWEPGWDIVHERNMAKRRAKPDGSDSKRGSPFDVVKPPGWYGPESDLIQLLLKHGWDGKRTP